jgi:hypothetical protein
MKIFIWVLFANEYLATGKSIANDDIDCLVSTAGFRA